MNANIGAGEGKTKEKHRACNEVIYYDCSRRDGCVETDDERARYATVAIIPMTPTTTLVIITPFLQ
jgi:hypothetical protein